MTKRSAIPAQPPRRPPPPIGEEVVGGIIRRRYGGTRGMIALVWRYEVKDEHRGAFEATYGPTGDWARLFARSGGFRGTELMRGDDGSYLTLDVWRARADFDAFMAEHRADYEALDSRTEPWTRCEHRIGEYNLLG